MDNLLISDALSFVRTPECQGVWFALLNIAWWWCLTCTNAKLDGLIIKILNVNYVLCLTSRYVKHCIYKCFFFFFFKPAHPSVYFHLSVLDVQLLCSVTPLFTKDPSHCYMPGWRQYPLAPSLYQDRECLLPENERAEESWKQVKKDGLSVIGK